MQEGVPPGDSLALLGEWRAALRARDLADKTIHDYTYGVWRLLVFFDFGVHPLDMDEGHIVRFLAGLSAHAGSKAEYAKGIRSFFSWTVRRGFKLTNPIPEDVMPRKPEPPPQERFEVEELTRLLIAAAWRDERRAWAILACLGLGCRRSEFVYLCRDDIDWARMVLHVRRANAKNRKARQIDIGPWAAQALRELERRADGDRLLEIQPATFNEWVKTAARDCGFPAGRMQRAHTLRASFASFLADEDVPLHIIGELMGHSNPKTTLGYISIGKRRTTRQAVAFLGPGLPAEATRD